MSKARPEKQSKPVSTLEWYDFVGQLTELIPDLHPGGVDATNTLLDLCNLSSEAHVLDARARSWLKIRL